MTEINWNIFKAKFYQRESAVFENLSYHLFCLEHNQPYGIFRFKNQTGIEVEPISAADQVIGFQSKYYDVKLADKKDDLMDSLKKAKSKNPLLTTLYIYLNKEFSESSLKTLKEPKYKTVIESAAKKLKISIIWKVPSNFEMQLSNPQNFHIAEYYFSGGSNIVDFLNGIIAHSENILYSIKNDIKYRDKAIHIARANLMSQLKDPVAKLKIVNGDGGCGKTALIKELFMEFKEIQPIYVFKALEFDVQNIQDVFKQYGDKTFIDFLQIHKNDSSKMVVIDSAESLSEINSREVFKEFLAGLIKDEWQIIFTTRNNYLDDLKFQFIDIYRVAFQSILIDNPAIEVLQELAELHQFVLPSEKSFRNLLCNLFYLDEYLSNYDAFGANTTSLNFKEILWNKKIQNSGIKSKNIHILRENCFLEIVKERVNTGKFFITAENCSNEVLALLMHDEIIKYDSSNGGYFITHDIYEEWALEVIISRAFIKSADYGEFFIQIGNSLPVRRSFRKWLSGKIADSAVDIENFINRSVNSSDISSFWKDEIFITILLAENTHIFFNRFHDLIVRDNFRYLKRIIFLLRIACKDVDETHNELYQDYDLKHFFTRPKGKGWNCVIALVFENLQTFDPHNIDFIITVLLEWTRKNPRGETTSQAGQIALMIYKKIETNEDFKYLHIEKSLIEIILNSSLEIKDRMESLIDEILAKECSTRDLPYNELIDKILTAKYENYVLVNSMPGHVIALARKCWIDTNKYKSPFYSDTGLGLERYYGIRHSSRSEYSPASAYQTPVYHLLENDFLLTLNFIIELVNGSVLHFYNSKYKNSLEEIQLNFPGDKVHSQFISSELWCMYRGFGNSPELLQCVHMALEKYLLAKVPTTDDKVMETCLLYMLSTSNSASITAVVSSIVKAYPGKYFNIEKILFYSPEILLQDRICTFSEERSSNFYQKGWNSDSQYYNRERYEARNQSHRKKSLESMMVTYQLFPNPSAGDETASHRIKSVHEIIDQLYERFPEKKDSSDDYMVKRLLISQLDGRKMSPLIEEKNQQTIISLNSEIENDLKEHSEEALKTVSQFSRYLPLKNWSHEKFDNRLEAGSTEIYDHSPKLALEQAKELLNDLKSGAEYRNTEVPAYVCAALLKEFSEKLTSQDLNYCCEVVISYAKLHLNPGYDYQMSDGLEAAISALPKIGQLFPDRMPDIKIILLLTLFDDQALGAYKRICDYAIETINGDLLALHGELNHLFITGFLKFKPLLNAEKQKTPSRWNKKENHIRTFLKKYRKEIEKFSTLDAPLNYQDIETHPLENLEIIFNLIPVDTQNQQFLGIIAIISPIASRHLLVKETIYSMQYHFRTRFFNRYAVFLLERKENCLSVYINPFKDHLTDSQESIYFIREIISAQDQYNKYDNFWKIWNSLYDVVLTISKTRTSHYVSELVQMYLLADYLWGSGKKEWHSLQDREKQFYQNIADDLGERPETLYSISKILTDIGSNFLNDGIGWLSEIISKQDDKRRSRSDDNTIFYLDNLIRKYVYLNREKVRKDIRTKKQVITILNFLVERTSVSAYLLREDIL